MNTPKTLKKNKKVRSDEKFLRKIPEPQPDQFKQRKINTRENFKEKCFDGRKGKKEGRKEKFGEGKVKKISR